MEFCQEEFLKTILENKREKVGFSTNTLSKLSKNESVTLSILEKICLCLNCKIEDVVEIKKE